MNAEAHELDSRWSLPRGHVLRRVLQAEPMQEYLVYVPQAGAAGAPIFVSVHGLGRNAHEHARVFAHHCEMAGVVMLAPIFTPELHPDYQRLGRTGHGVRADLALERCLTEVASLTGADATRIYLFGYSGGGQFAHRYLMAHPHRVARAVIAAAGWYTFPDTRRRFPYGIRPSRRLPGINFNPEEFLRVPITVLVGKDDVTGSNLRTSERLNEQQGGNRLQRARRWVATMQAAAEAYGFVPRVTYREVADVSHSFTQFCEHGALAEWVFDALFMDSSAMTASAGQDVANDADTEKVALVSKPKRGRSVHG